MNRESAEPRLVGRLEVGLMEFLVQSVKELLCICMLRELVLAATFCERCHVPRLQMYVNSDVNVLSFEGNFVLLHTGTSFNCCLILVC